MMYTSAVETRSNRPRALVHHNATSLPRIYHYETFAGTRDRVEETPKRTHNTFVPQSPQKPPPTSVKKIKTAAKAVHRLTTYWDVAAHYNALEYLRKRNIRIVEGPKFLYFLLSLLFMFLLCSTYMATVSNDHYPASSISSFFSRLFTPSHNSTLEHLREEANRKYAELQKEADYKSPNTDNSNSYQPSPNRIYEEQLEKYVKEDLVRLENQMKKLSEEQARKLNELTQNMDHKTRTLEDQHRKFVSESNDALTNIGKTEKSFADTKKDLTSQIERLQAELAKVNTNTKSTGGETHKEISDLSSVVDKLQKQKAADDAEKQKIISGLQSQVQQLQAELSKVKPIDNSKEIEELRQKVQKLEKELEEHKRSKPSSNPIMELGPLKAELAKGVHTLIQADVTGRVDYALLNLGARVVNERTSPSYSRASTGVLGDWWPISQRFKDPNVILTQEVTPGECWSMKGSFGHVTVKLAEPIAPAAVSIDHISPLVSPDISSAPREFSVLGLKNTTDVGILLGTFTYDINAETVQTFEIKDNQEKFPLVTLNILSNHGNENYTCIYRFRVHPHKDEGKKTQL